MKTAIVADFLVKMGGAERVVAKLCEMYPDAPLYTLIYDQEKCGSTFSPARVKCSFLQKLPRFLRKRYPLLFPLMPYAIESLDLSEYDLVISSSHSFAHGVITSSEAVHICYCHSPMRYAWDYTHRYLLEKQTSALSAFFAKHFLFKLRKWDKIAADRPDFYIANSGHVQKRIEKFYRTESTVIYPPVNVDNFELSWQNDNYYVVLATLTPYKKIDLAINLFNKIQKNLVIIGDGPDRARLEAISGPNIRFTGKVTEAELKTLLKSAKAMIFPSEEDFGIAMVEAMACGKPVLAYASGGASEIVITGQNGELFYSQTLPAFEDALGRMIVNEHLYKPEKIREHAEKFSATNFEECFKKFIKENVALDSR